MTRGDPTFATRDELVAWARQRWRDAGDAKSERLRAVQLIRRVTLAHGHHEARREG